ncbi:MAG: YifB family Mg chelatase-like AAA ATPase [Candidatus Gracilibacteria bacterium]|nr:YifB family Mg chelatase-like AAA ATPase [Candidatus Gracilibacteria bacterium]MDD4529997.1 YifB family Mg chelatase-like AAA ATPase [Candidatus Gracilibacteria bacterium]
MFIKVNSIAINGLTGTQIDVEVDVSNGMPSFAVVGLGDTAIQESRERVRTAIKNSGYRFPGTRITVNLAPATIKKKGGFFDLPIAIGIFGNSFSLNKELLNKSVFVGELALDGNLRGVSSILPSVIFARQAGFEYIFVPKENEKEASLIPGIKVVAEETFDDVIKILLGEKEIRVSESVDISSYIKENLKESRFDFKYIIGQEHAKRALLIAASGGHNMLMEGPPGSGKTMLSQAYASILPKLSIDEVIEISKIYSVSGLLNDKKPLIFERPFRKIHHTASTISIIGGGRDSKPGEISLAHKGVLFLDEFLEFEAKLIETLRQPIEDGEITINRVNSTYTYPAKFSLIGAFNPCPCGFFGDKEKLCTCNSSRIAKYRARLSGPILDRIDIFINVPRVKISELESKKVVKESSEDLRKIVEKAIKIQQKRFQGTQKTYNSEMSNEDIENYCKLGEKENEFLKNAIERLNLSTRAYFRILKLARTIADIGDSEDICLSHLAEAIGYRKGEEM